MAEQLDDDALLEALGVDLTPVSVGGHSAQEERIIAGFEEILRFHQQHGRAPQHGADCDIFERLYAIRLDRLRQLPETHPLLAPLDTPGLLGTGPGDSTVEALDEDALLAKLGEDDADADNDIRVLRHVRSASERKAAEDIAEQTPCHGFDKFLPLFERVERELRSGARRVIAFKNEASVEVGNYFILGGQFVYVAEKGEEYQSSSGQPDARLRVIYANGTESNLLMRSLQRALSLKGKGRRLTDPHMGPLFGDTPEPDDIQSGTIYVLRSRSDHPFVVEHRELIHKIGVTGGKVESRIASAEHDPTYLLAAVEIVAQYKLHNIHRTKLENLFHRLFSPAQIDIAILDRFGRTAKPREWFLVPLHAIDEAVRRISDGSITSATYDVANARFVTATPTTA